MGDSTSPSYRPPGVGDRLASSALTTCTMALLLFCVGLVTTIVVGGIAVLLLWVTGHDFHVVAVTLTQQSVRDGLPERPAPPDWVGPVAIGTIAVLTGLAAVVGAARFGHGTVGDGVTGIEARLADGATPDRLLSVLRVFIPIATGVLAGWLLSPGWAVLLLAASWLPALAPPRRTAVDLLLGIHPVVAVDAKLGRAWHSEPSG